MVRELAKSVVKLLEKITNIEYSERSHQVEVIGKYNIDGSYKDVICTVQLKHYIPRDVYGDAGYFYEKPRQRKVRNENREWVIVNETVTYYEMSEADKKFVYVSYVYHHLTQRQISKLSGIPQPYVYRYIKHNKLKPKYSKSTKSERNVILNNSTLEPLSATIDIDESNVEFDDNANFDLNVDQIEESMKDSNIDFEKPFHLDPYPNRGEWKVRREQYGLKNGENWRNTPYDENPGPKQYGDGSTVRRRKAAKQARKEKRRIKNIQKFNLHQNNRYNMTEENPNGIFTEKEVKEKLSKKRNNNKG